MLRTLAILIFAVNLAACDAVTTVTEGYKQAQAVERTVEQSTGIKPRVGFNWNNGRLASVTVSFAGVDENKPLRELAEPVRAAVMKEFKQTPETIVLAFSLGRVQPGTKADTPVPYRVTRLDGE
jgi:hypothetical protein